MRKIALAGIGKIAKDQHIPALNGSEDWELAATISRSGSVDGVPGFQDMDAFLAAETGIDTVSLALPPVPRFDYARKALAAGLNVMLEKPPGATLAEVHALEAVAQERGVTLYASWHSRMGKGVEAARRALEGQDVTGGHICWVEDVKEWHPGQDWVFEPGGLGVFDPGINAISILTEILPTATHVTEGTLRYPENRQTPITVDLTFANGITAHFDWSRPGDPQWRIEVQTANGAVVLEEGGNVCRVNGDLAPVRDEGEYERLYARLFALVESGSSEVDLTPLVHVSDAFQLSRRETVEAFHFDT